MTDILHETEHYYVATSGQAMEVNGIRFPATYVVRNEVTRMAEGYFVLLPEAITMAEQWNHAMVNKPWEWLSKKENEPSMH